MHVYGLMDDSLVVHVGVFVPLEKFSLICRRQGAFYIDYLKSLDYFVFLVYLMIIFLFVWGFRPTRDFFTHLETSQ